MVLATQAGPGVGLSLQVESTLMISTSAVVKGDVVAVTYTTVANDRWTTVDTPATADLEAGIFMVAMEDLAAGATGWFAIRGLIDVQTTSTPAIGAPLYAANAATTLTDTAAANNKILGYAAEVGVTGTATKVYFDGWSGVGNDNA